VENRSDAVEKGQQVNQQAQIRKHVVRLLVIVVAMLIFPFASVPLYNSFCKWTGLNGKVPLTAAAAPGVVAGDNSKRLITVEFVAEADPGLPWTLRPETSQIKVHLEESKRMIFFAENHSGKDVVARAVPSISPGEAASHFKKTQCFCFDAINLKAGEKVEMPVVFYLDGEFPKQVSTVTLAYKVFNVTDQVKVVEPKAVTGKTEARY
jgi:cytochrome c oxidase assembly protein subunit 11